MNEIDMKVARQISLREQVADKIRMGIGAGHFAPGQRLVERELCELLGVSRTSVREALRQLEAEGLITVLPHRGPIVSTIGADEAKQLYELRALLEGYVGQRCAETASPELKRALSEAVDAFERSVNEGTSGEWIKTKAGFYELLLAGGGNIFVRQTLESLYNRITLLRMASMSQTGRLKHSLAELREIVAAIQRNDGPAAALACQRHIQNAAKAALSAAK